ncbi:MAG: hypothetical protein LBB48_06945 [Treponema sp.]|nr:hypothetical protein [Treponema sp.]
MSQDGLIAYPKGLIWKTDAVEKRWGGETCRPHYAIDLHTMTGDTFKITKEAIDEALGNFEFRRGDLVTADRAYGTLNGITHCLNRGRGLYTAPADGLFRRLR